MNNFFALERPKADARCGGLSNANTIPSGTAPYAEGRVNVPAPDQQGPQDRLRRAAGAVAPSGGSEPHAVGKVGAL